MSEPPEYPRTIVHLRDRVTVIRDESEYAGRSGVVRSHDWRTDAVTVLLDQEETDTEPQYFVTFPSWLRLDKAYTGRYPYRLTEEE